jgi:glycine cleavage system H protein
MLRRTIKIQKLPRTLSLTTSSLNEIKYTREHYWVQRMNSSEFKVGLSDYAQDSFGDFVMVEIEKINEQVKQDAEIGTVESTKTVATIYAPISGEVSEMNKAVDSEKGRPQLINRDPLGKGWILKMIASDPDEIEGLLTEDEYNSFLVDEGLLGDDGNPIQK